LAVGASMVDAGQYYNKAVDKYELPLPQTKEINFRLGLDLLGGTHLIYQADVSQIAEKDKSSAVEGVRDVIERRVNVFGVSEPVVQVNRTTAGDYRVIVELAGVKDVSEAIQMIGETPLLEFKEESDQARELTEEETNQLNDFNIAAEKQAEEVLGKVLSGGDFAALAEDYNQDESTKESKGDFGWITAKDNPEIFSMAVGVEAGKTSLDLARTSQGYEIIKVEDKRIKKDPFTDQEEKEVKAAHLLICYEGGEMCENGLNKEDAYAKIKTLKEKATADNFANLVKENSTEPGAGERGGDLGWFGRGAMVKPFEDTVFEQEVGAISYVVETKFGYHLIYKQDERAVEEYKVSHILIRTLSQEDILGPANEWKNTELTGKNLERAVVQFNPNDSSPEVSLEFDNDGAKMFEEITERNVNKPVAIFLDGYPISVPTVNEKISGGKAVISGNFNIQEAKLLAQRLNAGALPVPIHLINQQTVGASLGQESVANSLRAGIIGLILVAIFMVIFYRLPGLLAVFALAIYGALILAIFKLWPVTLTLSGLAGFILSVGMAVDANVLIFERFKEELRSGKPLDSAIEEGFMRAWPSIRDGNVSTLITCFILIQFSTSIIKGFAITLGLGVLISMFSAIVITRNFLRLASGEWLEKRMWLVGVKKI
ncbi:protein translocase subunit SecD, partial [Candidatus Parcubacteria bacterium]|nr:protein translocase subunit SecD [Patescibacteria group bacterium]MCG2698724.1 protein translocase subunit SecD [Candidatus Parcubacteria bacterium]